MSERQAESSALLLVLGWLVDCMNICTASPLCSQTVSNNNNDVMKVSWEQKEKQGAPTETPSKSL